MKYVVIGIAALAILAVYLGSVQQTEIPQAMSMSYMEEIYQEFKFWMGKYNKRYPNEYVKEFRFKVFIQNFEMVEKANKANLSYKLGINHFSDLTGEEWAKIYLNELESEDGSLPEENYVFNETPFNWTAHGAVTPVKNQGKCGSCWSFAATGVAEGYWFLNKGSLPSLSEQQLVDCSKLNNGCGGGLAWKALEYVKSNGLVTEQDYPYVSGNTGSATPCTINQGPYKVGSVLQGNGCSSLLSNIKTQPTGVSVDASNWSHYKSGVFNNCGTSTNHAVLAVGWDDQGNWYIKNSWGTDWGENGYIYLQNGNTCAVCYRLANAAN